MLHSKQLNYLAGQNQVNITTSDSISYPICHFGHSCAPLMQPQVAKANGGHKKNVWEIMQCPEYALKCNKSVQLPTWVSFLCLLGDLEVIWAWFALWALWVILHKKNVWEIMRCPEYVLKCKKSVHLPTWVSFLCVLGDLSVICAASALGDSSNHPQITQKT